MNYSNTKIYKIWSPRGDMIYIGATTKRYLSQRLAGHKKGYRQWKEGTIGLTTSFKVFEEYGVENCQIELLEAKACSDKDDQKKLEGQYIRSMSCVNKIIPDRTMKEYHATYYPVYYPKYYQENREKLIKTSKEYVEANREKYIQYQKEYREKNRDALRAKDKAYKARKKAELNLI